MDKYEYSLKTEQLRKYALEGFFDEEALEICESINWKKEKDIEILAIGANVYEKYRRYEKTLFVLERIYKFSSARRKNAYHIIEVALEYGDYDTAVNYLDEYKRLAPRDTKGILLEYRIAKGRLYSGLDEEKDKFHSKSREIQELNKIIPMLERYVQEDCDEASMYELAYLYHQVGRREDCIAMCDQISIWFSVGSYVEKALRLKTRYVPLSEEQREMIENRSKYEARLKEFVSDMTTPEQIPEIITKEEAKQRAEKRVDTEKIKNQQEEVILITSLGCLEAEELQDKQEERKEEETESKTKEIRKNLGKIFAESAKSIHNRSEKVSIDSLEHIRKLKDEYSLKVEKLQEALLETEEVASDSECYNADIQQTEFWPQEFVVEVGEEKSIANIENLEAVGHFVVKSDVEKNGIQLAVDVIREKIKQGESISNQIAYTTGDKLNEVGVIESLGHMSHVVLFVKRAGVLSESSLWSFHSFMENPEQSIRVVLIDTSDGIDGIWKKNPQLKEKFQFIFSIKTLSVDDLAEYAVSYAAAKNYVLHDMALIPLYDTVEIIAADKKGNEKKRVEDLIDYAIEKASGKNLKQMIRNLLFVRQDEQGNTILYEKDFM